MANHHPSPQMVMQMQQQQQQHHGAPAPPQLAGQAHPGQWTSASPRAISAVNEALWMQIGSFSELIGNLDDAMVAYERALHANPNSVPAMNAISLILRSREEFHKAVEYLQAILKIDERNGEVWGSLGHSYLMMDDLQQAYAAYQNALVNLPNPKEPKLWYGIGILYDRYGSLDHAEEAFSQVMQMQPDFEKANEIYFRLGIIYKQQGKFGSSLECFKYIVNSPPPPLTEEDIWFQIGHVHEQQKDYDSAKSAYSRVLDRDPNHAKVLQQLGWLHHQQSSSFQSQERAIEYLEKSVAADNNDAQSWYLLGRCYMSQQKYPKAYEAYQQAVYRDGRNPTFWCSIGVLYYQINQYRDALDAYSRAIRLNPYISEVWYDLGTLYESCNNQISDALDAYQRAAELDQNNPHIKARLQLLRQGPNNRDGPIPQAVPTDVHPNAYSAQGPPPPAWTGSGPMQQGSNAHRAPLGPGSTNGWGPRPNELNPPNGPNSFDQQRGEPLRGPAPPNAGRPPSPRQEMRPYPGEGSGQVPPGPIRRGPTPPPPQYGPPSAGPAQQAPLPPQQQQQPPSAGQGPARVSNPNYQPAPSASGGMPSQSAQGPPGAPQHSMGPYPGRPGSPRSEGSRPLHDNRMPSPKSAYPQHQAPYPSHHQETGAHGVQEPSGLPSKGPGPHDLHREHERPSSVASKRHREWDDEPHPKKHANDENRARMDDHRHRRPSTPTREQPFHRSPETRRFEEQRHAEEQRRVEESRRAEEPRRQEEAARHPNDSYHPSEAAHHPPAHGLPAQLPPMQGPIHDSPTSQQNGAGKPFQAKEERPPTEHPVAAPAATQANEPERAARKMDVDEDYDDSGEEDKKMTNAPSTGASGPTSANPAGSELKTSTPANAGVNGFSGPPPKTESVA